MSVSLDTALQIVGAIRSAGHEVALLHGGADLRSGGSLGDLDLASRVPAEEVILDVGNVLYDLGWRLVMQWRYDEAGHSFLFMDPSRDRPCAQIDLLYDPRGVGPYGLKTASALASLPAGTFQKPLPEMPLHTQVAYLIVKGTVKRQAARIQRLESVVRRWNAPDRRRIEATVQAHFAPSVARWVLDRTGGGPQSYRATERLQRGLARGVSRLKRLATRVLFPPGVVIAPVPGSGQPLVRRLSGQAPAGILDLRARGRVLSEILGTIRLFRPGLTLLSDPLMVTALLSAPRELNEHLEAWADTRHEYSMSQLACARRFSWL